MRVFTVYAKVNPDIGEGVELAMRLGLDPRDVSAAMGRDAIEIFIPEQKFEGNDGTFILKEFTDLGYEVEERQ